MLSLGYGSYISMTSIWYKDYGLDQREFIDVKAFLSKVHIPQLNLILPDLTLQRITRPPKPALRLISEP